MDNIKQEILTDIRKAKNSVKIAVAWLTDSDFITVLSQKITKNSTFVVEIVLSNHKDNREEILSQKMGALIELGAKIRVFGSFSPQEGNFMHCKFYIVDDEIAKSGSYNWSKAAVSNIECLDKVELESKQKLFKRLMGSSSIYPIKKS